MKCVWLFITDHCDNAGVWIVNLRLMNFQISKSLNWESVRERFGARLLEFSPGKVWIPGFIKFQYGELSSACKPHLKILGLLKSHGLSELYTKGIHTLQEEDREEDWDRDGKILTGEKKNKPAPKPKPVPEGDPDTLAVYAFWKKLIKSSVRKADSLKWIERRGKEHGFETLVMSIVRYKNECNEKKTEEKFLKECANFFGEDATYEGFLPDPDFHIRYLDRALAVLKGEDEKED
jgi:hypothetical protein